LNSSEAASIGKSITSIVTILLPSFQSEGKFVGFAKEILKEAEENMKNEYEDGKLTNFIKILLNNRESMTEIEIQDEVATMIMAVSALFLKLVTCNLFESNLLSFRETHRLH
jgi:hypothetical protein